MTPLELFLTQEDGDWIRSPQVTAGHLSDAELFDPKRKWVKVTKDLTKWDESKHDRKADGKFAPKGQGEAGGAKPATPQKTTPKQVSVIRYDGAPIEYAPGEQVDRKPSI